MFELFFCELPPGRWLLMAAGLEQPMRFLTDPRFSAEDLAWSHASGMFASRCHDALADFRFTGNADAVP